MGRASKRKTQRRTGKSPVGFWDKSEAPPGVVSVRDTSSRLARAASFLLRCLGLGRRNPR